MLVKILTFLLRKNLSLKDRDALVNALINRLNVPTRAIITTDENRRILVQGNPLSIEQTIALREAAYALTTNHALKIIRDQVRFQAVDRGFLQSSDPETQLFYKAALLYAQEETELINSIAAIQDSAPL